MFESLDPTALSGICNYFDKSDSVKQEEAPLLLKCLENAERECLKGSNDLGLSESDMKGICEGFQSAQRVVLRAWSTQKN